MAFNSSQIQEIIKKFQTKELDTGSTEVQVALLTYKINDLTEHFKVHKKDYHGRRGLIAMVNGRLNFFHSQLLSYLKRKNFDGYVNLIKELELRK